MNFSLVLRALAFALFVLACFGVTPFSVSPIALGLACWVASTFA